MSEFGTISSELAKLKSEKEVGNTIVSGARDKYAAEMSDDNLNNMRMLASMKNKTYKKPKKLRRRKLFNGIVNKIRVVFGLDE